MIMKYLGVACETFIENLSLVDEITLFKNYILG